MKYINKPLKFKVRPLEEVKEGDINLSLVIANFFEEYVAKTGIDESQFPHIVMRLYLDTTKRYYIRDDTNYKGIVRYIDNSMIKGRSSVLITGPFKIILKEQTQEVQQDEFICADIAIEEEPVSHKANISDILDIAALVTAVVCVILVICLPYPVRGEDHYVILWVTRIIICMMSLLASWHLITRR